MHQETRNLTLFLLATFAATWATYVTIVFNGWNPYAMPGMAFLLIGGSAPSWVGVLLLLSTYDKANRRNYFRRCFAFNQIKLPDWAFIVFVFPLIYALITVYDNHVRCNLKLAMAFYTQVSLGTGFFDLPGRGHESARLPDYA